jgi:Tol biopolymer transport system component
MRTDGSDVRQLTGREGGAESKHPAWSPDGLRLCLASRRDGYSSLYLMKADGSSEERLTAPEDVDDEFPAWSPDGQRIAFSRGNGRGPEDLWVIDLATRDESRLTDRGLMDYRPTWSPDGAQIAFRRSLGRSPGVYVLPVAGGESWFVIEGRSPSWHPEGDCLIYSQEGRIATLALDADGHARRNPVWLTDGRGAVDDYPCWSADGNWLAFEREVSMPDAGEAHIFTMRADGDEYHDLGEGHTPAWSSVLAE